MLVFRQVSYVEELKQLLLYKYFFALLKAEELFAGRLESLTYIFEHSIVA